MTINTNSELAQVVDNAIKESGYKKSFIADKLGISRQAFSNLMNKQNFSIDDADRILNIINYKIEIEISAKK